MHALRQDARRAAEEARSRHFALGPTLVALRIHEEGGLRDEGLVLARRCASAFGGTEQAALGLLRFAGRARRLHFADAEVVTRTGEKAETCFVLMDGQVAVDHTDGRIRSLKGGDSLGELDLLRRAPRSFTATAALGGCSVLRLDAAFMTSMTQDHRGLRSLLHGLYRERALEELGCREGWLGGLHGEQRRNLLARCEERRFQPGDRLLRAGRPADAFVVLIGGEAMVQRDGLEIVRLGPGAFFGEHSVLEGLPPAADVVASTEVDALLLPSNSFQAVMAGHPDQLEEITGLVRARRTQPPPPHDIGGMAGPADRFVI